MAQIDFSNASIESINSMNNNIFWNNGQYLGLNGCGYPRFSKSDNNWNPITSSLTGFVTNLTESGFKVIYDGVMDTSGNDIIILAHKNSSGWDRSLWRIYNIEYEAGDTFHFQIDVDFSFD